MPFAVLGIDGPSIALEYLLSVLVLKLILGGALGEEAGWRGFAFPRLQARHGPVRGSLMLGVIWAGWHAPLYLDPARVIQNLPLPFAVGVVAMAVVYTWISNRTGGSLLLVMLLHAAVNSAPPAVRDLVPGLPPGEFFNLIIAGYVAAAELTIIATRGRLGYHRDSGRSAFERERSATSREQNGVDRSNARRTATSGSAPVNRTAAHRSVHRLLPENSSRSWAKPNDVNCPCVEEPPWKQTVLRTYINPGAIV